MSLVDWLLPLALPWTLSSSLRFPGVDAGPGEILLAAWMFSVWAQIVLHFNNYSQLRTPDAAVVKFWIASVPILLFSTVFSALHNYDTAPDQLRDVIAYVLVGSVAATLWIRRFSQQQLMIIYAVSTLIYVAAAAITLVYYWRTGTALIGPEYNGRFAALSNNANQPSVALAPAPFLLMYIGSRKRIGLPSLFWNVMAVLAIVIGYNTESDGLRLGWYLGALLVILIPASKLLGGRMRSFGAPQWVFTLISITAFIVVVSLAIYLSGSSVATDVGNLLIQKWDGDGRIEIWSNSIQKFFDSPFFGFGAGSQAYANISRSSEISWEAHNGFNNWALQAGLIGVIVLGWLHIRLWFVTWRSTEPLLIGALTAVIAQSLTTFTYRHPTFWVNLIIILSLATAQNLKARRQ